MDGRLIDINTELTSWDMDMQDWEIRGDGPAPYEFPEHILDELDCDKYMFGPDAASARGMYWGLIDKLADKVKQEYENDNLPVDSLAKAVLDNQGLRNLFELTDYDVSKLVIDKASRITDFDAAPDSEDGRRMKDLKREVDIAIVLANGGSDNLLFGSNKHCPLNLAAYDTMASMGYRPFLWEGGEPGDDKTPAFVMPEDKIVYEYAGTEYGNIQWEDCGYSKFCDERRSLYHQLDDFHMGHRMYSAAMNDVPNHADRMAASKELFQAVGDIGDIRKAYEKGTPEAERLAGIFRDFDASLVCCNIKSGIVDDMKIYGSGYESIPGTYDDVMAETNDRPVSSVDERGFQMLLDLGCEHMCADVLDFHADNDYHLKPVDVQQMRMDNIAMDYYTGHDERNGKLVTMAMQCYDDTRKWDKDLATDYVYGQFDMLLNPAGDSPKAKGLREQIFDQVAAAEIIMTCQCDASAYKGAPYKFDVVDEDCYAMLKSYGYENPLLTDHSGRGEGEQAQYEKMPVSERNEVLREAKVRQEPVALPIDRYIRIPDGLQFPDGRFENIPDGLDNDYPIV